MRYNKQTTFSCSWVKEQVSDFVSRVFTNRQNLVFGEVLLTSGKCTVSRFVKVVSMKHGFSETSVWHTVRKFRKMGLVDFGNGSDGKMFTLTDFGKIIKGGDKKCEKN